MNEHMFDYTNTFAALTNSLLAAPSDLFRVPEAIEGWHKKWQLRIANSELTEVTKIMRCANPAVIPRNQLVEQVIEQFTESGNSQLLTQWLDVLNNPYNYEQPSVEFVEPLSSGINYHTFCGT